ncbi:hypothetical protein H0H92_003207 [Tricholoma furcatifolium]|nr:hypothetical protein H0H92_003207 [Tricholoma furcatifolium]
MDRSAAASPGNRDENITIVVSSMDDQPLTRPPRDLGIQDSRTSGTYGSTLRPEDVLTDRGTSRASSYSASTEIDVELAMPACTPQVQDPVYAVAPGAPPMYKKKRDYSTKVFWDYIRSLYHIIFFGAPNFYKYRVHQIFREVSYVEDKVMDELVVQLGEAQLRLDFDLATQDEQNLPHSLSHMEFYNLPENAKLKNLKTLWEGFINKCLREWKAGNLIAILLLAVIVSTLQLGGTLSDGIVRTGLFLSLICAFMSLLYGCVFWVRFSAMHPVHKAFKWAKDSKNEGYHIVWNTWILLSMPVTWLCWSLIFYLAAILSYIWRTSWEIPGPTTPRSFELVSKITPTVVLVIGILYFGLIMRALHRYGSPMDIEWRAAVRVEAEKRNINIHQSPGSINREC